MFEGWVFSLVAGYLGNYIKDIHREQFRIGLWSGVALLENAELRLEAFDYLQLPFAIKQGFVGKLRLQVSWKTLLWEPILVALEDVHICACPRDESEWNATAAESRELASKKAKLAAAEITKLSKQVPDEKVRQSLLSHLLAKVIDNIQVTIRNIHIRYVDKKEDPEGSFYFGVKLAGLSVGTTDARGAGNPAAKSKTGFVHKSVEINQLSVYWNSSSTPTLSRNLTSTLGNYLSRWFAKKDENLSYILYPMGASIKLTVNRSASSDGGAPLYALAMSMDKLDLNLSDRQLYEMFLLIDSFKISRVRERYGRFRPHVGLSTEERSCCHWQHLWWKYAIDAVLSDVRKRLRRSSWRYLAWRLDCRRRYVALYKEKLLCFQEGQAPEDDIIFALEDLEKELDLEMISSFRALAERKFALEEMVGEDAEENNQVAESASHPRGWLNVFSFGILGKSAAMDSAAEFTGPLSDEIMKDIYKATNFHPTLLLENESSKGYCLLSMNLHLRQAVGRLENSCSKNGIVEVVTSGIFTTFRKLQDVATAAVACKAFEVKDVCTEGTLFPHVAISKGTYASYASSTRASYAEAVYAANGNGASQRDAAIRIDVELSEDLSVKVSVFMRPFEVIYSRTVAEGLLNFLQLPTSCEAEEFYTGDSRELQSASLTKLSLNVDARDVVFIIPNDSVSSNWVLAIPLESMHFSMANINGLPSKENGQAVQTAFQNHLIDFSLNHFEVKLAGIQARVAKGTSSGEGSPFSWVTVMDKFNADIDIKKIKDSWDTRWKVDGNLSATKILVSAAIYAGLGTIIAGAAKPFLQFQPRRESTSQPIFGELFIKNVSVELVLSDQGSSASVKALSFHIEPLRLRFSSDTLQDEFALSAGKIYMENLDSPRTSLHRCLFSTSNDSSGLSLTITRNSNEGGPVRSVFVLQDADCHIHRNVIAALTGFVLEISEARPTATGESSLYQAPFSLALQLDNVSFLMHDVYGVLATLVLSKSDFLLLSSAPEVWELEGKASDVQISGPEFATHGMNGIPFRRLNSQQPSSIHLSVVKKNLPFPVLEIQVDLEGIECILHSDYLVLLIGFFRSSEWKSTCVSAPAVEPTQPSAVPYQVKVKNSVLMLPIGGGHHIDIGIPEFCFSFVPLKLTGNFRRSHPEWYNVEDANDSLFKLFYIMGRELTLSNYGLEPGSNDRWLMPLIDMLTGDILIEVPDTSDRVTNIRIKFPVIQLSCIGHALLRQIEWVDFLSMELASVGWKSLHATDIWGGIISGKPFTVTRTGTSKPSFNLQWYSDQLTSSFKLSRKGEPGLLDTVAVMEARSTTAAYSVDAGVFQHFELKLDNVIMFDPSYKLKDGNIRRKVVVSLKSETSNVAIEALPLNPSRIQVDILVPRLEVWLRFSSWNKIISWTFVCFPLDTTPSIPTDAVTVSLEMGTTGDSVLHLKTTVPSLMFFLPDCSSENQRLTEEDELGKAMLFTSSFSIDELEVFDSRCSFTARFTQVKAETKTRALSGYPCLATANIHIGGVLRLEFPVPSLALTACVDSIDCWCSYPILQFLNAFELESSIEDEEESLLLDFKVGLKAEVVMLSLLLTDGRWNYNCPLLEMIFEKTFLELSFIPGNVDVLASTLTEISYHNIEKVVWEPFLEPWRFTGSFHFTELAAKVEIMSPNNLNINVTEALSQASTRALGMIAASRILDMQRHVVESLQKNVFSQYAPYWFQNDTGMTVSYSLIWPGWNGDKSLENDATWQWRTVLPGSSVPLFVNEEEGPIRQKKARWISSRVSEQKKIGLMSHRRIRVRLEGTSGASLPMSIDLVGRRAFEVVFSAKETDRSYEGKQFSTHAVLEVSLQHHSKLIRLHSTVTVANSTSVPIEVRLEIPFGIAPKILNPILPSEVIPLPVHLAETGRISWRPYKKDYLWSEAQPLSKLLGAKHRPASQRLFVCYPSRPSQGSFRCCVSVEDKEVSAAVYAAKSSSDKLPVTSEQSAGWKMWNVLLQAPLAIMNCLPCAMDVIVESGGGVNAHTSIPKGDSVFFYDVDVVHDLSIRVTISSFLPRTLKFGRAASRDREEITERPVNDEMTVFDPESPSGLPVYARVDKVTDLRSGARKISLVVPYWIYNCSGLNLSFLDGDVDVHVAKEQFLPDTYKAGGTAPAAEAQGIQSLIDLSSTSTGRNQSGRMLSHLPSCKIFTPGTETSPAAADSDCNDSVLPLARLYSPTTREVGENKMRLRAAQLLDSTTPIWSQPFLLDPPGGNAPIVIPKPSGKGAYVLSITSIPAMGSCSGKTKTVTFRPRFVLANASRQEICFKQQGTGIFYPLAVGQNIHVHWTDTTRNLLLSLRYNEHGWDWSGGFAPDRIGDTQVKVHNHLTGVKEILRVVVSNANGAGDSIGSGNDRLGTFYIIVTNDETGFMPYRIDNFSMEKLRFYQKKCEKTENVLQPYSSCDYAWDEPCLPPQLVIEVPGEGTLGTYPLDVVKSYPSIQFHASGQKPEGRFVVSVHAEASRRVLSVVDLLLHTTKDLRMLNPRIEETFRDSRRGSLQEFSMKLASIAISLVDSTPQELALVSARGFELQFFQTDLEQKMKMEIGLLQVDNQLRHAIYPVLLSTAKSSGIFMRDIISSEWNSSQQLAQEKSENLALSAIVSKWRHPIGSVHCYQCIYLSVAPLRLELEERSLTCLLGLLKGLFVGGSAMGTEKSMSFIQRSEWSSSSNVLTSLRFVETMEPLEIYKTWPDHAAVEPARGPTQKLIVSVKQRRKVYVEAFHIDPLELTVSFSSIPWLPKESRGVAAQSLLWVTGSLLQRRLIALADVEGAPIRLRHLTLAHPMANWNSILGIIQRHYTRQLLHEVYKVLGSADVFGNPMSFMRSLGSGVWDFVYAPATSIRQNPGQIVQGVTVGTRSLFRNTVFAFSNAATQWSKAARKGMAALALDQDYMNEVEIHNHWSRDSSIVNEFLEGLTGLLQSSVRGAERHGIPGVFSGMAVGVIRAVARPAASMLEVAGKTAQSIRNSSRPSQPRIMRLRLPRHLEQGSPLLPYSWNEALGTAVLREADDGRLREETYITCQPLFERGVFVLLTENLLVQVKSTTREELESSGCEWKLLSENNVEDILYIDRQENNLDVLFCSPNVLLAASKATSHQQQQRERGGSSSRFGPPSPFKNVTLRLNSCESTEEFHSTLVLLLRRKQRARLIGASMRRE